MRKLIDKMSMQELKTEVRDSRYMIDILLKGLDELQQSAAANGEDVAYCKAKLMLFNAEKARRAECEAQLRGTSS